MRRVEFNLTDRLMLTPVELANSFFKLCLLLLSVIAISGISLKGFSVHELISEGLLSASYVLAGYLSGAILAPALLPWVPARSFAGKGLITGAALAAILLFSGIFVENKLWISGIVLLSMAISSFMAMNFTGASTYTSLSGVKKEMKIFVPIQIIMASVGVVLIIISNFWGYENS